MDGSVPAKNQRVMMLLNVTLTVFAAASLHVAMPAIGHAFEAANPGVAVSGGCDIGRGCLLGAGAVVLEHLSLEAGVTVGSGAVVTKHVAAGATVVGIPARPLNRGPEQ